MKQRHLLFAFIAVCVFIAPASVYAQSIVSHELMQQLRAGGGIPEQAQRQLQGQGDPAQTAGQSESSDDNTPFWDADVDDLSRRGGTRASVYEALFSGRDIFPETFLSHLRMFGHEVFASGAKPGPGDMGGVPADHPIRPGDEMMIHLWGRINERYTLRVSREGTITIPHNIGPVTVAGLPFTNAQRAIADRLSRIEGVNVSVSMGDLRPISIYVVGEVNAPGLHTMNPLSNVTNAIFTAGGITQRGSLRNVQLRRGGRLISEIDFYEFLISGNDRSNLRLQPGDVIVVPVARQVVAVAGNVRRSALYELKGPTTKLSDVLDLAGGVSPAAYMNRIQVERFEDNSHHVVLDIVEASGGADVQEFMVRDGDLIKVFPVLQRDKNAVYLSGNVMRPGKYEFREGMRISDIVSGLLPETHFDYAIILRKTYPLFIERIIPFNLGRVFENAASPDNLLLEAQDEVVIYSSSFFTPDRNVNIEGAVTTPGTHKLLDNMAIRDLILKAGGLADNASHERGELYRRTFDGTTIITQKVEFSIERVMRGDPAYNIALQRGDRIFIRSMKGWEPPRSVRLHGQVYFPGTYVLLEHETLGDLIDRAGGFRPDAYLPAAVFTRQSVRELEARKLKQYNSELEAGMLRLSLEMASKGYNTASLLEQQMMLSRMLSEVTVLGRVMIDMTDTEQYATFVLEDGDDLFIPKNLATISVLGEVYNPATFRLNQKFTVRQYLDMAGGPRETANQKDMYIVRANGSIVSNRSVRIRNLELEPGDVVVIPTRIRYPNRFKIFLDSTDAALRIGSFFATLVTLIVAVNALNNNSN